MFMGVSYARDHNEEGSISMNPMMLLQLKGAWEQFQRNHPKFPMFLQAVSNDALTEGTVIEFNVTTPEGKNYCSNLRLTASDMELIEQIKAAVRN